MKIVIGSDHAGYEMKEIIKAYLVEKGNKVTDVGTNSTESVDYPVYGKKVGLEVTNNDYDFGIVICGTGIGISIAANKVEGVRAAVVHDVETARLAKEHNNANVITFGGRTHNYDEAVNMVDAYINAHFEERHQKRIDKITKLEKEGK